MARGNLAFGIHREKTMQRSKQSTPSRSAVWIIAGLTSLLPAAGVQAQNAAKRLLFGDTQVEILSKYQGDALPKPEKLLIYDFAVPADVISVDESAAARLNRQRRRTVGADSNASPEAVAKQVQASFSKSLLKELQQASVQAAAAGAAAGTDTAAPPHTLLVQGEFTAINEGSKTKRILLGFGKGASDVKAHVTVSLTSEQQPVPILEFNVRSKSGKKPGAAATVGAGAATLGTVSAGSAAAGVAAGGALDRASTVEADASRMAKGVAKQIAELMKSQPWASPQPPEPK
jgi:hypothetical protein